MRRGNRPKELRVSKQEILDAIPKSGGILTVIARRAGISTRSLYDYRIKWPEINEAIKDAEDETIDMAESQLVDLVKMGNLKAIRYFLDNRGKKRGWGQRQNIQLESNMPIQPIICFGDSDDDSSGDSETD